MRLNKLKNTLATCLGILLIGCLVQVAGSLKGDQLVFPDTGEILCTFLRLLADGGTWQMIGTTLLHLLEALLLATVIGIPLGMVEGGSEWVYCLFRPMTILIRSLPMIVLVILIMVLTHYSRVPLIATGLVILPLISEGACEGIRGIDPELKDVYRLCSGFNATVFRQVHLPLMAGHLRESYRNAAGMGLKVAVTTEYLVQTRNSLGKAVYSSAYFNEYAEIYAYALIMVLLVLGLELLPVLLGRIRALTRRQSP